MIVFLVPLVLITFPYLLYYYLTKNFDYWQKRNVPGPKPVALFGNLLESTLRRKNMGMVIKEFYDSFPNEKLVGIYRMTTPALLIRDLDLIKHVMIKDFDVFADRGIEFSKKGLGANLFHADGDTWRVLRERFSPIFTSGKLKNMLYLITERGDSFVDYVENICQQQPEQEVHTLVQKYTIATICACAFGIDINTLNDKLETLRKIDSLIFTVNYANELDMMYPGILKKLNSSVFPAFMTNFFYELSSNVIKQRNGVPTNRKDFMDLILELRQQGEVHGTKRNANDNGLKLELTEDIIAAQVAVFYSAGYETSATTMAFLLYQLAMNPDVQDKLIAEIDEVLERNKGEVTYDTLQELHYLGKVFNETMRTFSLADVLQRNAQRDYTFPGTNVTAKKGQTVIISSRAIHNDEKYYPNPEKFDPERFSSENVGQRHPCAFMPFGTGPRNCIGMRFAQVQSRVCIVKLLSKFRFEPSKNTPRVMKFDPHRILMSPLGGIHINIVKRCKV